MVPSGKITDFTQYATLHNENLIEERVYLKNVLNSQGSRYFAKSLQKTVTTETMYVSTK